MEFRCKKECNPISISRSVLRIYDKGETGAEVREISGSLVPEVQRFGKLVKLKDKAFVYGVIRQKRTQVDDTLIVQRSITYHSTTMGER
ncbi:hypothetical protein QQP08_006237 [Theobroma cacao]|nr:hypothetical protein QQP08_006237 [Theobroma cacao]